MGSADMFRHIFEEARCDMDVTLDATWPRMEDRGHSQEIEEWTGGRGDGPTTVSSMSVAVQGLGE